MSVRWVNESSRAIALPDNNEAAEEALLELVGPDAAAAFAEMTTEEDER